MHNSGAVCANLLRVVSERGEIERAPRREVLPPIVEFGGAQPPIFCSGRANCAIGLRVVPSRASSTREKGEPVYSPRGW